PAIFVILDSLPLLPNGKVNFKALPLPTTLRPNLDVSYAMPQTAMEQTLATVWQEILQIEHVGNNDNFFDLGGHSLLVVQLQSKLQEILQRDVPIIVLFKHPTIRAMARYLEQEQSQQSTDSPIHNRVQRHLAGKQALTRLRTRAQDERKENQS